VAPGGTEGSIVVVVRGRVKPGRVEAGGEGGHFALLERLAGLLLYGVGVVWLVDVGEGWDPEQAAAPVASRLGHGGWRQLRNMCTVRARAGDVARATESKEANELVHALHLVEHVRQ